MEFNGSKTEQNLRIALAGESQNITAYKQIKKMAKKTDKDAADAFEKSLETQKEHARLWFEALNGGVIFDTISHMHGAAKNADEEWAQLYTQFAQTAKEEGFDALADQFTKAAAAKTDAAQEYAKYLESETNPNE
jgi:rubrerythrin